MTRSSSSSTSFDRCGCCQAFPAEHVVGLRLFLQASLLAKRWCWEKHLGEPSELEKEHLLLETALLGVCNFFLSISRSLCFTPECCPVKVRKKALSL